MAGFGFAGAALGANRALSQQQHDAADLENALAEREYRRQLILNQQEQQDIQRQRMAMDREQFAVNTRRQQQQDDRLAAQDRQKTNELGVQQMVGELIRTQGITPQNRGQIVGTLMEAGQVPSSAQLFADPEGDAKRRIETERQIEDIRTAGRIREIEAQGAETRRNIGARPPSSGSGGSATAGSLPAAMKSDLADMGTLYDMTNQVETLGNAIGWKGVGGLGTGTVAKFAAKNLGIGDPTGKEEELRNGIGNITATLARLRGGTSFTANEQTLLEQYTPTINDGDKVIQAKLRSLRQFIQTKRANALKVAGGDLGLGTDGPSLGERRMINGELGEWDGQGWAPVGGR